MEMMLRFLPGTSLPVFLRLARLAALGLLLATGGWSPVSAFRTTRFHWRGGGPMPKWLGQLMSVVVGILLIWAAFAFSR